ncbi:MAG: oxidoreductase, partial [Burkholderiales bacterium PBB5]
MTPLRLALAGAGQIGRAHAQRIAASIECQLVALVDPAPAAQALASAWGVPLFTTLDAMAAGVPVLVEKPVADSVHDARRLVRAQQECGVPVLVGHHRRHSAVMAAARAVIQSGRLGRLVAVNGSATFVKPARYFTDAPWRGQIGGGPILINGVHEVDNLRALVGEITAV